MTKWYDEFGVSRTIICSYFLIILIRKLNSKNLQPQVDWRTAPFCFDSKCGDRVLPYQSQTRPSGFHCCYEDDKQANLHGKSSTKNGQSDHGGSSDRCEFGECGIGFGCAVTTLNPNPCTCSMTVPPPAFPTCKNNVPFTLTRSGIF